MSPGLMLDRVVQRARTSVDRSLGPRLPAIVRRLARDGAPVVAVRRLLVLAPHPDDETLGAGMTVQRALASGADVVVVVATDGRYGDPDVPADRMAAIRREEIVRAAAALGIPARALVTLGFEDGHLLQLEDQLTEAVEALVREHQPDVVIAPSPLDLHPDHAALGRCARRAVARHPSRLLEYLVWGWEEPLRLAARLVRRAERERRLRGAAARPVVIGGIAYTSTKARALACHASQFAPGSRLYGEPVGGSGPLGDEFLRAFRAESELFFPWSPVSRRRTS